MRKRRKHFIFNLKTQVVAALALIAGVNFYFQVSIPTDKQSELFGYKNFISGMGYSGSVDKWYPMLILNLKYRL